jgi:hypothetical protein
MASEPQAWRSPDAHEASGDPPHAGRPRDVVPLGPRGPNPLRLHAEELDVVRRLQTSGQPADANDPVWDELEALGLVEMRASTPAPGGLPTRYGVLTSLGRRYRTD